LVIYVYTNEISKKNWEGIAAGLSLYLMHFLCYDWKPKVQGIDDWRVCLLWTL